VNALSGLMIDFQRQVVSLLILSLASLIFTCLQVTPYKTMFQIQYFNVVLWTAIGLTITLISTIYLMLYMPLMPDTLLFGESAKVMGDD